MGGDAAGRRPDGRLLSRQAADPLVGEGMPTTIIANPTAGSGRFAKVWHDWHGALKQVLGSFDLLLTKGPGDATHLVRDALREGATRIGVVGGDGSFNEAMN